MTDIDHAIGIELEQLVPLPLGIRPDWSDVRRRVAQPAPRARIPAWARRRPLLAVGLLIAVAVPVGAFGAAKTHWWFLSDRVANALAAYQPWNGQVVVIRHGSFGWVLTGYRSRAGFLCYQLTETSHGRPGRNGAGGCGPQLGQAEPNRGKAPLTISAQSGGIGSGGQTRYYVVGPVVGRASTVTIQLVNGTTIHTPTFAPPSALGMAIRFYAVQKPAPPAAAAHESCRERVVGQQSVEPTTIVGLDAGGSVVARLAGEKPAARQRMLADECRTTPMPFQLPAGSPRLRRASLFTAPYGATATLLVGATFEMHSSIMLPSGRLKPLEQPSRCWEVTFAHDAWLGTCLRIAKRTDPNWYYEVEHDGRDTFVVAQTGPRNGAPVIRVGLELANGKIVSVAPVDGVVVIPIPSDALSTTRSQRGFLIAYDAQGNVLPHRLDGRLYDRQVIYYRSCPPGSSCAGR